MQKEKLEAYVSQRLSSYKIAKLEGKSQTAIRYWLKKYNLKTNGERRGSFKMINQIAHEKFKQKDWSSIKNDYELGMERQFLFKKYGICNSQYRKARKIGILLRRSLNGKRKHSKEAREKMSIKRKEYLSRLGKAAWKTSNKQYSKPCAKLKEHLASMNIKFESEEMPLYNKGRYFRIDVAFPDIKFGIEINGRQHYDADGHLLPYYQNRHDLIISEGWELLEIPYHHIFSKIRFDELIDLIKNKVVGRDSRASVDKRL